MPRRCGTPWIRASARRRRPTRGSGSPRRTATSRSRPSRAHRCGFLSMRPVRPISTMQARKSTDGGCPAVSGTATGRTWPGTESRPGRRYPTDILSLASAFELLEDNPTRRRAMHRYPWRGERLPVPGGQRQDARGLHDYFGVALQQSWSSSGPVVADIYIDVNGGGKPDFDLTVTDYSFFTGNSCFTTTSTSPPSATSRP